MYIKKFNDFLNESDEKTNVVFYIDTDGQPLAYFPDIDGDNKGNKTCYSHVGQHSACHPDYVKNLKLATPDEYKDLEKELIGQGYDDLNILKENVNSILHLSTDIKQKVGEKGYFPDSDGVNKTNSPTFNTIVQFELHKNGWTILSWKNGIIEAKHKTGKIKKVDFNIKGKLNYGNANNVIKKFEI